MVIRSFNGHSPRIAGSAFVSETAYIIGDVEIGENSGVWPGAVIRGDLARISIGNNTMIEDNCVIHTGVPMEIGDNVIVGHSAVIHGSMISGDTLIGSNATVLNNAHIGSHCVIAAGCLVSENMKIPENSLVTGVPAKVKGQVSARQRMRLQQGLKTYGALVKNCKEQGL